MKKIYQVLSALLVTTALEACGPTGDLYGPNPYSIPCEEDKDCREDKTIKDFAKDRSSEWYCRDHQCTDHESGDAASDK